MPVNRYYSAIAQDTTLTSAISNSATNIVVGATTGFPASYPFTLALDFGDSSEELVDVTSAAGLTLTVTRGVNGTTAVSHNAGAIIRHVITARDLTEAQEHIAATSGVHGVTGALASATTLSSHIAATGGVHGVTGAVVGTTDTQTLTNKTIDYNSNTITNLPVPTADGSISDSLMLMGG